MRYRKPSLIALLLPCASIVLAALLFASHNSVTSQTRDQKASTNGAAAQNQNSRDARGTPTPATSVDVVKVDVDLVKVDALVLMKNTARIVGGLKKEDFLIYEDGAKQEITHFK